MDEKASVLFVIFFSGRKVRKTFFRHYFDRCILCRDIRMFRFMSGYPIAIDIGNDAINVAQLGESKEGPFVRGFASLDLDSSTDWNDEAGLSACGFIKDLLKEPVFGGKKAVMHLPPHSISSFPVNFQAKKNGSIDQMIAGESAGYISFPVEDTIIDYPSLLELSSGAEMKYRALIVATRKSIVESFIGILKKAGLNILAIDYDVNSLIRLHSHTVSAPEEPVILCSIDNTQTIICAVSDKGILAERHISWGMKYLLGRLQKGLDITGNGRKISRLLKEYGLSYERIFDEKAIDISEENEISRSMRKVVFQVVAPYLEELIDEIHKVTAYLRSDILNAIVKEIYLYGCAGAVRDVGAFFKRRLRIPVRTVDYMKQFKPPEHNDIPPVFEKNPTPLVIGLALRGDK